MADTEKLVISPYCCQLRSKKYYFLTAPPQTEADILDASNGAWCARTMDAVGKDGWPVFPSECQAGRTCFEPHGPKA